MGDGGKLGFDPRLGDLLHRPLGADDLGALRGRLLVAFESRQEEETRSDNAKEDDRADEGSFGNRAHDLCHLRAKGELDGRAEQDNKASSHQAGKEANCVPEEL